MGDFSRDTNDPRKHYSGVLMQQGRVQLDADWNEQLALQLYRTELEARDVIGACGVPKKVGGFEIGLTPDALDLTISPGRIYVEGMLCESDATPVPVSFVQNAPNRLAADGLWVDGVALAQGQWVELSAAGKTGTKLLRITAVDAEQHVLTLDANVLDYQNAGQAFVRRVATLRTQPDYPGATIAGLITGGPPGPPAPGVQSPLTGSPPQAVLPDGNYLVFLHAWKREVTALDDPHIRETALGGPDTATRLRNVWQVRLLHVAPSSPPGELKCDGKFAEWDALVAAPTGRMNARTKPAENEKDPCLLPPSAGFTRLENQLYRVEVQRAGPRQTATFKWSRDNAVVRTSITHVNGPVVTVADVGRDEVLGFAGGQWVEITDEESVLTGAPRQLAQIDQIDPSTREVTLKTTPAGLTGRKNLQLVRWDQADAAGPDGLAMTAGPDGWIDLEGGVQVHFSEGNYRVGDYWLIPARTATGEIEWPPFALPNTDPAAQPPLGVRHHFCRLALVEVSGGQIIPKDCRKLFPALTEICAEDICVDNTACDLPDVSNLQDMLDRLCAERDLRWHNKHLHGWGIVCGLQVECGPDPQGQPRRHVTVRPGYALDCDGRDIVLDHPDHLDLVQMAGQLQSPPTFLQNGEVCLRLELDGEGRRRYRLEEYKPPQNELKELLAGTLLMDFYNDCVKPLVDFFREEFTPDVEGEQALVGPARKRAITFGNLFIQYAEPVNGSRVFLSGDSAQTTAESEHTILRDSYTRLRALLQSHTFCAMFEGARPFPEYPYTNTGIATIFGRGNQTRVRINPASTRAYTVGADHRINVYDLATNQLVEILEFPGGASAVVRDVAFSASGNQLYAVATLGAADSLVAVADVTNAGAHHWRTPAIVCAAHLMTLGTAAGIANRLFAIGKGKGLYEIDLTNLSAPPVLRHSFNAVGHLAISSQPQFAWATAGNPSTGATEVYDRVLRMNLSGPPDAPHPFIGTVNGQSVSGRDDIAFVTGPPVGGAPQQKLYMVVNPPTGLTTKHVVIFNAISNTAGHSVTNLGENTRIRLANNPVTNHMMVTYEDSYRVGLLDPIDNRLQNFSHPVQLKPLSIAVAPNQGHVYVLNFASNTLNKIPAGRFAPNNQLPLQPLIDYRADVIEAYTDLIGGLFQYLKDCFCDHLLVNCPTCEGDEKIYLAAVRFRDGQVYKVCNFSGRKYVKSFPTYEYWLSIFPIIPLVGKLVEKICCAVFPSIFSRYEAERDTMSDDGVNVADSRLSGEKYETGVMFTKQTNFRAVFTDQMMKLSTGRQIAQDSVANAFAERKAATPDTEDVSVPSTEVTGLNVEEATAKLTEAGVIVEGVERYEPRDAVSNLARLALSPRKLRAGARVTLVEKDGVVRLAEEAPAHMRALREEVAEAKNAAAETRDAIARTEELKREVGDLRRELAARDEVIAELRRSTEQFREHAETLRSLSEQVDSIKQVVRIPRPVEQAGTEGGETASLKPAPKTPQRGGGGEGQKPPGKGKQ